MSLWTRIAAMVAALAIPLALALASQGLAARPEAPPVSGESVRLTSPVDGSPTPLGGAASIPTAVPSAATPPTAGPRSPRVVAPLPPRVERDDDIDDPEDDSEDADDEAGDVDD